MPAADIKELADDIKQRGLQNPITLFEGKILDGRHRYEACAIADVPPKWIPYKGDDPLGFVIAQNLKRRHLTPSQKAMVAASIENMPHGRSEKKDANLHLTRATVADSLDISPRTVATASKILDESPKLAAAVRDGKMTVHAASEKLAQRKVSREPVLDATGWEIPEELHALWARRGEVREMMAKVTNIETQLLKLQKDNDELFAPVNFSDTTAKLQYVHMHLRAAELYAVCSTCQGRAFKKCAHCKGRGILSKFAWSSVPSEIKAIREKASRK
jgi:hypothetical protein